MVRSPIAAGVLLIVTAMLLVACGFGSRTDNAASGTPSASPGAQASATATLSESPPASPSPSVSPSPSTSPSPFESPDVFSGRVAVRIAGVIA